MNEPTLTLMDHLVELRTRLIKSAYAIVAAFAVCFHYSEIIFDVIRKPIQPFLNDEQGLIYTAPADKFVAHLKVSFYVALMIASPFWFYQLWKFISPGLKDSEKKYGISFVTAAVFLFFIGAVFSFFIALPASFEFFMSFGGNVDKPFITINEYMSFVVLTTLLFGLAFELPLVIVILGLFGIVSAQFLRAKRRMAVVILSVLAAVLTPSPDAFSMFVMLIPLYVLFEISIFVVGFFERNKELN